MKKIAIVHPEIGFGGPETVLIWAIESLKEKYDVDVITCRKNSIDLINTFYGSSISENNVDFVEVHIPSFIKNTSKTRLLKQHLLMRYCKKMRNKYDLFISTYGEMDFGKKGIQYIHFPEINCEAKYVLNSRLSKNQLLKQPYQIFCKALSRYSQKQMRNNITLVNSHWTKDMTDKFYRISSIVAYPPVVDDFPQIEWDKKKDGFVVIGRISPDKRILEIIDILKKVRGKGFDVHLHILGNIGMSQSYVDKVKQETTNNSSWVFYEGKVSREKLRELVSTHKYGISGKKFEHFGIAIAEMVKSGSIIFVNNDGGQTEIVANNKDLIYNSDEDAVRKITEILKDASKQREIQKELYRISSGYSRESFMGKIKEVTEAYFKEVK